MTVQLLPDTQPKHGGSVASAVLAIGLYVLILVLALPRPAEPVVEPRRVPALVSAQEPTPLPGPRDELLSRRVGFGRAAGSGSRDWPEVVVENLDDNGPGSLREAISQGERWVTFAPGLSGTIELREALRPPSDIVIDGRGAKITLRAGRQFRVMEITGVRNVIVTNLRFRGGLDGIFIRNGARHIWLDHLTGQRARDEVFAVSGSGDSAADRPDLITISWTRVEDAGKVMLLGSTHTEINNAPDRITLHHNLWAENTERHPLMSFARVHFFNNWLYHWGDRGEGQGVRVGADGQFYSENNVYDDAYGRPGLVAENVGTHGAARSVGDVVTGEPRFEERRASTVFDPADHYSYVAQEAGQGLRDLLAAEAGWQATGRCVLAEDAC